MRRCFESQDFFRRTLRRNDNGRRRIASRDAWENGRIDYEQIIRAINLCVEIHHGFTPRASVVGTDGAGTNPMVGVSRSGRGRDLESVSIAHHLGCTFDSVMA